MAESISPEPGCGGFPKRRAAAVSRLTVPSDAEGQLSGIPSCHSDAPPQHGLLRNTPTPSGRRSWVPPRISKPGYQAGNTAVLHNVFAMFVVVLLVAATSVSMYRQRRLGAVVTALQEKHKDEMNMQVAWLSTTMQEHEQCKAALQLADADHKAAKAGLQTCQASVHKCEEQQKHTTIASETSAVTSRAAAAQLKVELESSKLALKLANEKLQKQEQHNKDTQDLVYVHEAQIEALQAQLREEQTAVLKSRQQQDALQQEKDQLLKDKQQLQQTVPLPVSTDTNTAPTATTASASRALSADDGTTQTTSSSAAPVVVVMCTAADMSPHDLITPWSQAVVAAGVPHVMLVSDDDGCVAAAKAAGIKVLQHTFQVPGIPGPLAQQNVRVYQRYAAVQQVLSLGHRCVSVQPELLLLSDPLPLLAHHPADVSVMSTAWGDENMAYGHLSPSPNANSPSGSITFQISSFSPALISLQPQPASHAFLTAMLEGLASGQHSEQALLNALLLPPWHLHDTPSPTPSTTGSSSGTAGSGAASSSSHIPALATPVRVSILPPSFFTSSELVFRAKDPKAWLKQHQPVAVQLLPGSDRVAQAKAVVQWLEADIQEVIQTLEHLPEDAGMQAAAGGAAAAGVGGGDAKGVVVSAEAQQAMLPPPAAGQQQQQAGQEQDHQKAPATATEAGSSQPTAAASKAVEPAKHHGATAAVSAVSAQHTTPAEPAKQQAAPFTATAAAATLAAATAIPAATAATAAAAVPAVPAQHTTVAEKAKQQAPPSTAATAAATPTAATTKAAAAATVATAAAAAPDKNSKQPTAGSKAVQSPAKPSAQAMARRKLAEQRKQRADGLRQPQQAQAADAAAQPQQSKKPSVLQPSLLPTAVLQQQQQAHTADVVGQQPKHTSVLQPSLLPTAGLQPQQQPQAPAADAATPQPQASAADAAAQEPQVPAANAAAQEPQVPAVDAAAQEPKHTSVLQPSLLPTATLQPQQQPQAPAADAAPQQPQAPAGDADAAAQQPQHTSVLQPSLLPTAGLQQQAQAPTADAKTQQPQAPAADADAAAQQPQHTSVLQPSLLPTAGLRQQAQAPTADAKTQQPQALAADADAAAQEPKHASVLQPSLLPTAAQQGQKQQQKPKHRKSMYM